MKFIVNMACGLANRMFQYSYYLFLKHQGYHVEVDFYHSAKLAHEKVAWNDIFPKAKIEQASSWDVLRLGGGADFLSKIRRRYLPFLPVWSICPRPLMPICLLPVRKANIS